MHLLIFVVDFFFSPMKMTVAKTKLSAVTSLTYSSEDFT